MPDSVARRVCRSTIRIVTSPVWSFGGQSPSPEGSRDAEIENMLSGKRRPRQRGRGKEAVFYFWGASPAVVGRVGAGSEADGSEDSWDPPGSSCLPPWRPPAAWGAGHCPVPPGSGTWPPPGSDTSESPAASSQLPAVTQGDRNSESLLQVHNIWDTGACWWFIRSLLLPDDGCIHRLCLSHVTNVWFSMLITPLLPGKWART